MASKLALFLPPGFADWEYALLAGTGGPYYGLDVRFFTEKPGTVVSQGGLSAVVPDDAAAMVEWKPDAAAVIGSAVWMTPGAPDLDAVLNTLHSRGSTVAGICGGTLALARAGLLDGVKHTSNAPDFLAAHAPAYASASSGPEANRFYQDTPRAVHSGRVITAPGSAPVTFAAAVFAAAGVPDEGIAQLTGMMRTEHG